jgi:hypothetical protein
MHRRIKSLAQQILLAIVYGLGVAGILASGDGSGSSSGSRYCDLVVRGIAPTTDGSDDVWVGVLASTSRGTVDRISRLGSNGSERFGVDIATGNTDNAVRAIAIAVEGGAADDLYVGGDFSEGILRLNDDGTLDGIFDANVGDGFNDRVTSIVPVGDTFGNIYVGGNFMTYKSIVVSGLVRLNDIGDRDGGFAPVVSNNVESVAMEDGAPFKVYSGGTTVPATLERWVSNGDADSTPDFDPIAIPNSPVFVVTPEPDLMNDVYIGGNFAGRIIRLNNIGTTDVAFNIGLGFDDDVTSIVRTDDASFEIYVGGEFTTYDNTSANGIIRLNTLGTRVGTFNSGTGFRDTREATTQSQVASIAISADGSNDLFVGGGFSEYNGKPVNGLARLNADGSLDTAFEVRIEANGRNCNNGSIRR